MSAFDLSIIIDDYKFTLISKTDASFKGYYNKNYHMVFTEERKKVVITSQNIRTGEQKRFYAYTSVSQLGTWRLCILEPNNRLNKFDNYIQATLIDIRLQNFINMNFDLLPYSEASDTFSSKLTSNQIAQITSSNKSEKTANAFNYEEGVNPNGSISCFFNSDISSIINRRWIEIFPTYLNLRRMEEKSHFFNFNYNLLRESLKKIVEFEIELDVYTGKVEMYEITATNKNINPGFQENIIFQIGKFILNLKNGEKREGYYIFNIIEPSTKITCYGLYSNYISGTFQNPYSNLSKREDNYISKPLNYKEQPMEDNQHQISRNLNPIEDIGSKHYSFTAYKNNEIFPIQQIREFFRAQPEVLRQEVPRQPEVPIQEVPRQEVFLEEEDLGPIDKETLKKLKSGFLGGKTRRRKSKKSKRRKSKRIQKRF
jgi:hypothetical protein